VRLSQLVTSHYRSPARNEVSALGCILVDQSRREGERRRVGGGQDVVEELRRRERIARLGDGTRQTKTKTETERETILPASVLPHSAPIPPLGT